MCVVFCVSNQRPGRACVVVAANAKGGAYPVDAHRHASEGNLTELETQAHISISSHHRLIFIIVSSLGTPSVLPIIRQSGADGHRAASRREERGERRPGQIGVPRMAPRSHADACTQVVLQARVGGLAGVVALGMKTMKLPRCSPFPVLSSSLAFPWLCERHACMYAEGGDECSPVSLAARKQGNPTSPDVKVSAAGSEISHETGLERRRGEAA